MRGAVYTAPSIYLKNNDIIFIEKKKGGVPAMLDLFLFALSAIDGLRFLYPTIIQEVKNVIYA